MSVSMDTYEIKADAREHATSEYSDTKNERMY